MPVYPDESASTGPAGARLALRRAGLVAGPLAFAAALLFLPGEFALPDGELRALASEGRVTLGLLCWMAIWWLSEAIDVPATALLPLVVLPLAGAGSIEAAAAPYASPLIYLFLGGFLLAIAMQRWGLDRRIAFFTLRLVGTRPARMIGGFMIATAAMSACVSNTATVAMMLPIALSVTRLFGRTEGAEAGLASGEHFRKSLFLAVAYAASIGGLATLIGSPPNGFLAQYSASQLGVEISFLGWLRVGLPVTVLFLPLCWLLLTRVLYRVPREEIPGARALLQVEIEKLGPMQRGEWAVLLVFCATVLAWISRPLLARVTPGISDPGIAITAALALFALPVDLRRGRYVLDWTAARELPWGVLVLFGGGLSLAQAVGQHGVAEMLGAQARHVGGLSPIVMTLAVTAGVIFLTELTSNTATAATLIPLLAALAPGLGADPFQLVLPATLAASCAFMLPVATPPNAIVFGSGYVGVADMARAGLWMNLCGIALITGLTYLLVLPLLGVAG